MTILIVEYIPYVAFAAAAGLMAWVGVDVLKARGARARRAGPESAQDSGRGLVGPAKPLGAEQLPEPAAEVPADIAVVDTPILDDEAPPAEEPAPAVEPEMPVSQAARVVAEPAPAAASEKVIPVRRDPSVRVFDTAVAPSERKVLSAED